MKIKSMLDAAALAYLCRTKAMHGIGHICLSSGLSRTVVCDAIAGQPVDKEHHSKLVRACDRLGLQKRY